jgi:hypothetical protein
MSWFRKKSDPISDRARILNEEIEALEARIKTLDDRLQRHHAQPRLRSTALPHGAKGNRVPPGNPVLIPARPVEEPIFEEVGQSLLENRAETPTTAEHYNELGVRKYDLPAFLRRVRNHFRGPATTNPKLVSYLAAGGIQGLRPLRYEKRVARNRFILLVAFLFLILLGLVAVFVRRR